jgi:tetratricopeptide (TPR) repeat protein
VTRRELEDERSFLLRSLEDLDREHEVGDLSDEDHARLRDGYIARTAVVLKTLEGDRPDPSTRPAAPTVPVRPGRRNRWVIAALVAVVVLALLSVVAHVGPRLPGESVTGSVTLTKQQQLLRTLTQAETLESQGNAAEAVKLYGTVLQQDPNQEQALAEVGWLEYEAGAESKQGRLLSLGESEEERAATVDPGDFAPHLYLGSMLLAQGDATGSVAQYRLFLADHPPRARVTASVPFIIEAFSDAHVPPPALPVGKAPKTSAAN